MWKGCGTHTAASFNLVLNNSFNQTMVLNDLFNQLIPGFILLLELHLKPVKDEAGTHQGQNESY
jgi:hypothetical protein